jgi:cobalt-zinc-cadmium efflux system membrane fusion protein
VETEAAKVEAIESRIDAQGMVAPAPGGELVVVAPEPARIAEMPKAEGDAVKVGDVLVRFDIPTLASGVAGSRADVATARARVDTTRAAVERLTGLVDRGIAAQRELEEARRDWREAEAALLRAESEVGAASALASRAVVTARFAGVVAKRYHNPGDLVEAAASDPILRVIDPRSLQVIASVPAADVPRVVVGHDGEVFGPGATTPETVTVVARPAQLDPTGSVGNVRLGFKLGTRLTSGTPVRVSIVAEEHAKAIVIPSAAVVREDGETFVMVAGADKMAHKKPVTVGLVSGEDTEILKGISPGDNVIIKGQSGLPDGAAITVEP